MSFFETYTPPKGKGLESLRKEGFEAFKAKGLPTPKTEDWRYADLGLLKSGTLQRAKDGTKAKPKAITNWPLLVITNGALGATKVKGVEVTSPEDTRGLYAEKGLFDSPLERLNLAYANGGVCLKICKDFKDEGLEIVFVTQGQGAADFTRNQIMVEGGVKAKLFIRTICIDEGSWGSQVTNFNLGKKSNLSVYRDFEMVKGSLMTVRDYAKVATGANFDSRSLLASLPSARYEVEAELNDKNAHADLSGGMLAGEGSTIDVLTRLQHTKGQTTSNQTFKGVAGKKGKTAFQGRVRVEENAQKIEAHQNCHNLIVERSGEVNVKPELLIFADDVVCSHGATVGEVDEVALFYLMQRGIPENQARGILVQAFLGDILEKTSDEKIRAHFAGKVDQWMAENLS